MSAQKTVLSALSVLGLVVTGLLPLEAGAHARWKLNGTTPPRTTSTGLKTGPCGAPRTANPTILTAGQTLKLQWEETVNHPGYYRIAFSPAGDTGFDQNVLVPKVDDNTARGDYETTITVPNTECTNCTLQMIQYMTENNPPSLYFSCADIEIRKAVTPEPPLPPFPPLPTPTVKPSPACD